MRKFWTSLSVTALTAGIVLSALGPAKADPSYTSDKLISIFAKDKAAADEAKKLGKARKICFEGDPDCAPAKAPARVDLFVTFEFNSETLTPQAKANLDQFAAALKDPTIKGARFEIDGFTDATGTEQYNQGLSERRANAVVAYLSSLGVDSATLTAKGWGKAKPRVADPFSPENRRVETHLAD